jgi:large subunit ribosomal protein L28
MSGHTVSHSEIKTNRRFLPNLQKVSFLSEILGARVSMSATSRAVRTVEKNGGIDAYLLNTGNSRLSAEAVKLKKRIGGAKAAKAVNAAGPAKK